MGFVAKPAEGHNDDDSNEMPDTGHSVCPHSVIPKTLDNAGAVRVDGIDGDSGGNRDDNVHEDPRVSDRGPNVPAGDVELVRDLGRVIE